MPEDVPEREFDVSSILCFTDTAERPVVDVEHTDGIIFVTVVPKKHQRFIVIDLLTEDRVGRQIEPFESGLDTVLDVPILTNDVKMHTFHDEIGIIDETGECPGEHLLLPIDVCGGDLNHEGGV